MNIENISIVLETMFDILHFSDKPYEELIKRNRELLDMLYKKEAKI